jgi:hypothetical protein
MSYRSGTTWLVLPRLLAHPALTVTVDQPVMG